MVGRGSWELCHEATLAKQGYSLISCVCYRAISALKFPKYSFIHTLHKNDYIGHIKSDIVM